MGSYEKALSECGCMCGKGKFKVAYRTPDKGREGIEYIWEIDCPHCRELYKIEHRGHVIGVVKKANEGEWEKKSAQMGKEKSRVLLHKPKFIKILYEINDDKGKR